MLRKLIPALLSVGALSTSAYAQRSYDQGRDYRVDDHARGDNWYSGNRAAPVDRDFRNRLDDPSQWFRLTAPARLSRRGGVSIPVDTSNPPLRVLRLVAAGDESFIERVAVKLDNGQTVYVEPGAELRLDQPMMIDLGGYHRVRRIVVFGRSEGRDASVTVGAARPDGHSSARRGFRRPR